MEKKCQNQGNFVTLSNALETDNVRFDGKEWSPQSWCADSVRVACADGGDTNDDGNFETETANSAIMRLHGYNICGRVSQKMKKLMTRTY